MMRAAVLFATAALAIGGTVAAMAQDDPIAAGRARLKAATLDARRAGQRSRALDRAAAAARAGARHARAAQDAIAARITLAEADRRAAQARVALVAQMLAQRRNELNARREPIARIVGALQSLASRPAWIAVAQPGSTDDLVHVRAMLGTMVPAMQARTAAVRAEIARTARLRRQAGTALAALADTGRTLELERLRLVRAEAAGRLRSQALARGAMVESDRAIALGEQARDIVEQLGQIEAADDTRAALAMLPGPLLRPDPPASGAAPPAAYRLPVGGSVTAGFGEISPSGVRSRGLTLTVRPGAPVLAPAAGIIAYSARFRGYGRVVILDHGDGWTTTVTGLSASVGPLGARVASGTPIGRAARDDPAAVTIELRRRGVPVDLAAML